MEEKVIGLGVESFLLGDNNNLQAQVTTQSATRDCFKRIEVPAPVKSDMKEKLLFIFLIIRIFFENRVRENCRKPS